MGIDTFKTASFLSGRAAAGLNPNISYSATRLRRVVNPALAAAAFVFQGSTSGYATGGFLPTAAGSNIIEKFPFASDANATDVGDLTQARARAGGISSSSDGYTSGGATNPPYTIVNTIDKFPFASNANATDVGDLSRNEGNTTGQSSGSNGYTSGGGSGATGSNIIDKFPVASNANATDVGDLTVGRYLLAGQSSTVSGYSSGGFRSIATPTPINAWYSTIDKFSFSTNANATTVGNITVGRRGTAGQSSTTDGYNSSGQTPGLSPATGNIIDKFPFATDASASDVGDLTVGRYICGSQSSTTSGYTTAGFSTAGVNIIDKFPFASNANASDVGDLTASQEGGSGQQV